MFKQGCSVQYVLVIYEGFYDCKEHHLYCISCPESLNQLSFETSDGHCLTSIQLTRSCYFFNQTINNCHGPSLVRKLFLLGVWPPIFLCS